MTRAFELLRTIGFYLWLALQFARAKVERDPVPVAVCGVLVLAAIQVLTGTSVIGRSTQKAIENVCELLLLLGLGSKIHHDVEALPHEGKR